MTIQMWLPIDGISERESPSPEKAKPQAIRPRTGARRRVNKQLQPPLPLKPPQPPAGA